MLTIGVNRPLPAYYVFSEDFFMSFKIFFIFSKERKEECFALWNRLIDRNSSQLNTGDY